VLLSVCCLIAVLWFARIDYQHYFANVQLITFCSDLQPSLSQCHCSVIIGKCRQAALPIVTGVVCGSAAGILTALAICFAQALTWR